jgi:sensor c-di-GMP phosphodiesterase-like protein
MYSKRSKYTSVISAWIIFIILSLMLGKVLHDVEIADEQNREMKIYKQDSTEDVQRIITDTLQRKAGELKRDTNLYR